MGPLFGFFKGPPLGEKVQIFNNLNRAINASFFNVNSLFYEKQTIYRVVKNFLFSTTQGGPLEKETQSALVRRGVLVHFGSPKKATQGAQVPK